MPRHPSWTRDELIQVLRLYMRLPFGRLHRTNPDVVAVASAIGRTSSAVAMKACNFASLDPAITSSGRKGLASASEADRELWAEFQQNSEAIAAEAEAAAEPTMPGQPAEASRSAVVEPDDTPLPLPKTIAETEVLTIIRARRVQSFFRAAVLTSYNSRCAITGLAEPRLLNSSHIIPWSRSVERRADPTNGICFNALFDRAFDRGLLSFDDDLRVILSRRLRTAAQQSELACSLLEAEGRPLSLPSRFLPDIEAIRFHRETVFQAE